MLSPNFSKQFRSYNGLIQPTSKAKVDFSVSSKTEILISKTGFLIFIHLSACKGKWIILGGIGGQEWKRKIKTS